VETPIINFHGNSKKGFDGGVSTKTSHTPPLLEATF